MLTPENLRAIEFTTLTCNSDGEPVVGTEVQRILLFNRTQISIEEVSNLINNDEWEWDNRVIEVTKAQLEHLRDKKNNK